MLKGTKAQVETSPGRPHYLDHRKRLRGRFLRSKDHSMPDYELLEILLTYAVPRIDVKPLAKALLTRFGTLKGVLDASPESLQEVKRIGPQSSVLIALLRQCMRRYFELEATQADLVNSPEAVVAYCRASLEAERRECFEVLYLSSKNQLIRTERLSEGTLDRTTVYPRQVIEGALKANAAALIFVHNHPSGDPSPSAEDRALTDSLVRAAKAVGIVVHDHIVVGNGSHFSFRAEGQISPNDTR